MTRTVTYTEDPEILGVCADVVSGGGLQLTIRFRQVRRDANGVIVDASPEQKDVFIVGTGGDITAISKAAVDTALNAAIAKWVTRKYG